MNRISITIRSQHDRDRVAELAKTLAVGMRVDVKQERRSSEQNSKMWACLHDIADQVPWHGVKLTAEDYKYLFLDALKREIRVIPNLDGNGFVNIGRSSSDLSKEEFSDLLELMAAFGANHAVKFHEPDSSSPESSPQVNAPAANTPPPSVAAGATNSDSSDGNRQADLTDAPAAGPSRHADTAAGAHNFEEASLLSDDWRYTYFNALIRPSEKKESLITKHNLARQLLGGEPNERELLWMRLAYTAVKWRNEGTILPEEFTTRRDRLLEMPLPALETAA